MYFPDNYRWSHGMLHALGAAPRGGEGDSQIPLATAQMCFDAIGSGRKTFKVFTRDEGGYHHCQVDNASIAVAYMWDWLEDVFGLLEPEVLPRRGE